MLRLVWSRFKAELCVFAESSREVRTLLLADSIYAFVLPVIEIFVAAYVLRNSSSASMAMICQVAIYAATPLAFWGNGLLLRYFSMNQMYALGMFLSGVALCVLTKVHLNHLPSVGICGGLLGLATGIYWANRGALAIAVTNDQNRNYFYGLENSVLAVTSIAVPWVTGALIDRIARGAAPASFHHAYSLVTLVALLMTMLAALLMQRGNFPRKAPGRFIYFRFPRIWYRMLSLSVLRGIAQGYIITAPALLVLRLVGREGVLGTVEGVGSFLACVCLYVVGRRGKPHQRGLIMTAGILLFLLGALVNALFFNPLSVLFFIGCLLLAKPLIDMAYNTIVLHVVDEVVLTDRKPVYAYLMNHEIALLSGRGLGCGLFVLIAFYLSEVDALRYALLIVAILQLPAIYVARYLSLKEKVSVLV